MTAHQQRAANHHRGAGAASRPDIARLGEGGFGHVYRLSDRQAGRVVVVKLMPRRGLRARLSARLARELGNIAALSHHDHMVGILGWGRSPDDRWYVALEEAPGGSMADFLAEGGTIDWRSAVRLGLRLARVLELAHDLGVVHRDIKPANLLLDAEGQPLLTDMGLGALACAFSLEGRAAADSLLYAAPEAAHTMTLPPQSDVYALGATLRALLGWNDGSARRQRRDGPAGLAEVLDGAMAPRIEDRYPTMGALRSDLELLDDGRRRALRVAFPSSGRLAG